jgi:hypothetical protein
LLLPLSLLPLLPSLLLLLLPLLLPLTGICPLSPDLPPACVFPHALSIPAPAPTPRRFLVAACLPPPSCYLRLPL